MNKRQRKKAATRAMIRDGKPMEWGRTRRVLRRLRWLVRVFTRGRPLWAMWTLRDTFGPVNRRVGRARAKWLRERPVARVRPGNKPRSNQ